jgi:hypothetical protein
MAGSQWSSITTPTNGRLNNVPKAPKSLIRVLESANKSRDIPLDADLERGGLNQSSLLVGRSF